MGYNYNAQRTTMTMQNNLNNIIMAAIRMLNVAVHNYYNEQCITKLNGLQ